MMRWRRSMRKLRSSLEESRMPSGAISRRLVILEAVLSCPEPSGGNFNALLGVP